MSWAESEIDIRVSMLTDTRDIFEYLNKLELLELYSGMRPVLLVAYDS